MGVFLIALLFAAMLAAAVAVVLIALTGEAGPGAGRAIPGLGLLGGWSRYRVGQITVLHDLGLTAYLSFWSYVAIRILTSILTGVLAAATFGGILGAAVAVLTFIVIGAAIRGAHARRARRVSAAVAEFGQSMLSMMRAGTPLIDAVTALGEAGPALLREPITTLSRDIREVGMDRALSTAAGRIRDPLFDLLAVSMLVQHETGGESLEDLEYTIGAVTLQQAQLDRAAAMQAQTQTAAVLIPIVMVGTVMVLEYINGSRPDGYFHFYRTTTGQIVQLIYFSLFVAGYFVMRRLQRVRAGARLRLRSVE